MSIGKRRFKRWWLRGAAIVLVLGLLVFAITDWIAAPAVDRSLREELTAGVSFREIEGAQLAFRQAGDSGDPLLLIHGFLGSSYDFNLLMPELARDRQVIAVDQIGFGLSDKDPDLTYSKAQMARLCIALMADLGHDRYDVLGHSMGGEVGLQMAVLAPEQVRRLVLLNSAGLEDLQRGMRGTLPAWFLDGVFKNYLIQRLGFPFSVYNRDAATTDVFNHFFFFNNQIPASTLNRLVEDNDSGALAPVLDQVRQPALLVWGAQDRVIPLAQGEELDRILPASRLVVLEDCGHLTFLEKPEETLAAVRGFLDEAQP
ncbi:MAG: alpha/beta hydrolase [Eubacteriales bacterium]|nr:alpha/beta hydrolase [Eubacteriales bacterium]